MSDNLICLRFRNLSLAIVVVTPKANRERNREKQSEGKTCRVKYATGGVYAKVMLITF